MEKKFNLILASKSPRRKELLGYLDIPFEILTTDISEESEKKKPSEFALEIAQKKGQAVFQILKQRPEFSKEFFPFSIASDTIVVLGDRIYGKPVDSNDAREILMSLSDHTHKVITAVDVTYLDLSGDIREFSFFGETDVTFSKISNETLFLYLKTGESMDKAGAYGIQGAGLSFIDKISGSYSNVVGFPLSLLINELNSRFGNNWRDKFHGFSENN